MKHYIAKVRHDSQYYVIYHPLGTSDWSYILQENDTPAPPDSFPLDIVTRWFDFQLYKRKKRGQG